ncbi:hypothetical protein COPCOM_01880 [Coprococcus comes ATCC 27758]|uniref:Uncharacterized protein n=1 Tax=Coprococcus comes ATCC 27758 TaxID=470146 RepID=C0B9Q3_9FIRM|nr:hypothetical protein COPCOM_01880 [Coprococcus comes ATCC 27758]
MIHDVSIWLTIIRMKYMGDQLSNLSVCNICKRQSRRRKWL